MQSARRPDSILSKERLQHGNCHIWLGHRASKAGTRRGATQDSNLYYRVAAMTVTKPAQRVDEGIGYALGPQKTSSMNSLRSNYTLYTGMHRLEREYSVPCFLPRAPSFLLLFCSLGFRVLNIKASYRVPIMDFGSCLKMTIFL